MDALLIAANWLLPLIYLAVVIDYGATFILRVRTHVRNPWIGLAILFHATFLVLRGFWSGRPPLASNPEILSVIALSCAIVYWAIELAGRDRRAGVFFFMLIFLFQYTSSMLPVGQPAGAGISQASAQQGWGRLHVLPASLAYTALAFAAVYAMLYLLGRRNLKRHRLGLLFDRLPPLELLGRMNWYALVGGFVLMTITVATGCLLFAHAGHPEQRTALEPKVASKIIIGTLAWIIYAAAILGRLLGKWPVSRVCRVAVAGFVVIIVLLVTSIVLS